MKKEPPEDEHDAEELEILEGIDDAKREAAKTDTALAALISAIGLLARATMMSARRMEITVYAALTKDEGAIALVEPDEKKVG